MGWEMLLAAVIAFFIAALSGKIVIPYLIKLKFGQSILEIGPKWHMAKQGTPTMGGIMFIIASGITTLLVGIPLMMGGDFRHIIVFAFALAFGVIGFIDDYAKVVRKQNQGLSALQKLLLQLAVSAVFLSVLRLLGDFKPELFIPFTDITLHIPWIPYLIIMIFVIVGAVNAVNLTDGIDGLATCVTMPVAIFFMVMSALLAMPSMGIFSAALLGALAGFLIYNFNPAKVFMGDTGSLFLGGAVCGLAFAFDMPLILLPVGIIYIVETLSVILQVTYFKITHGKRLFKMAPIHHHLEIKGWNERKICAVFTLITIVGAAIAVFGARARYPF
ncbi:MAG: phospho-N-acetylmuramoyl-pentapeptide-transferase [Clostridia bacterium]